MMFQQVKLTNYTAFGEKVKAWAKGTDQIPNDLDELKEQLAAAQVGSDGSRAHHEGPVRTGGR